MVAINQETQPGMVAEEQVELEIGKVGIQPKRKWEK